LGLELYRVNVDSRPPVLLLTSENFYDKDELKPQLLPGGRYILRISETTTQSQVMFRRCQWFLLAVRFSMSWIEL